MAGDSSVPEGPARRVSFSELLGVSSQMIHPPPLAANGQPGLRERSDLRLVKAHFQPRTCAACSIHLRIKGPCASSKVLSFT
jgi:hypothetical protein